MGDTGSLALGRKFSIAALAIIVRKELLIPIFVLHFVELCSVMIQVSYFKYTKRKYGEGVEYFMSPLHHHHQN
jgi:phospho-N-acetylmuramoyl-pentapeptide-transferase